MGVGLGEWWDGCSRVMNVLSRSTSSVRLALMSLGRSWGMVWVVEEGFWERNTSWALFFFISEYRCLENDKSGYLL